MWLSIYFVTVVVAYFLFRAGIKMEIKTKDASYGRGDLMFYIGLALVPLLNLIFSIWCYLENRSDYDREFQIERKDAVQSFFMIKEDK